MPTDEGCGRPGSVGSDTFGADDYARLYNGSIQKFLTYSIIGAATFVGYVQLSIELHSSGLSSFGATVLRLVVVVLFVVVIFTVLAAARQYFLIATLHGSTQLRMRGLENLLTEKSPRVFQLLTQVVHGFDWSSTKERFRSNALMLVIGVVWFAAALVLAFALS